MGLFHYRCVLKVSGGQMPLLQRGIVDAVLPLPFLCWPDTRGQYGRFLTEEDQAILWDVLEASSPDLCGKARQALSGNLLI